MARGQSWGRITAAFGEWLGGIFGVTHQLRRSRLRRTALILSVFMVIALSYSFRVTDSLWLTWVTFAAALLVTVVNFLWAYGINQGQAEATALIRVMMPGQSQILKKVEEQIDQVTKHLSDEGGGSPGNLRMLLASPAFGIAHSAYAVGKFLDFLEKWINSVVSSGQVVRLEVALWDIKAHRMWFGAKSEHIVTWEREEEELLEQLARIVGMLRRLKSLHRSVIFSHFISVPRTDFRVFLLECINGRRPSVLMAYTPLNADDELRDREIVCLAISDTTASGFFRYAEFYEDCTKKNVIFPLDGLFSRPMLWVERYFDLDEDRRRAFRVICRRRGLVDGVG